MKDIGKREHALKHSYIRYVVGTFDKILHGGSSWTGNRTVLSFILNKTNFFTL